MGRNHIRCEKRNHYRDRRSRPSNSRQADQEGRGDGTARPKKRNASWDSGENDANAGRHEQREPNENFVKRQVAQPRSLVHGAMNTGWLDVLHQTGA